MFSLEAAVAPARIRGRATDLLVSLGRPSKEIFLRKHSSLSPASDLDRFPFADVCSVQTSDFSQRRISME